MVSPMTVTSPAVPSSRAELPVVMWMIVFISIETLSREISGLIAARSTRRGDFSTPLRCGRNDARWAAMVNHRHRKLFAKGFPYDRKLPCRPVISSGTACRYVDDCVYIY